MICQWDRCTGLMRLIVNVISTVTSILIITLSSLFVLHCHCRSHSMSLEHESEKSWSLLHCSCDFWIFLSPMCSCSADPLLHSCDHHRCIVTVVIVIIIINNIIIVIVNVDRRHRLHQSSLSPSSLGCFYHIIISCLFRALNCNFIIKEFGVNWRCWF